MAGIDNVFNNIKLMPMSKKVVLLAVVALSIVSTVLLISWINRADYQVLYSSLSEDDAGKIVQELRDRRIDYRLESASTILVPSNQVYDLRLQLAGEGLPQGGGVGFEIFDNTSFTTSEFVQKLNFKRALEGELSRTIRSLTGVHQSRVHLVIPDRTMFAFQKDRPKPSAAVFLSLQKGRKLEGRDVEGIIHLVSSSVEDLDPKNITVVDSKGELLTKPESDDMLSLSSTQMEYQHNYEKNMSSKILSILEPVVGRDKIRAKVSANFDFTRSERTEEIFDPEGVVVRSEQKSTEKTSSGRGTSGVPGVESNQPGGTYVSSLGESQKLDEMINYETSKTIKRVVESPVSLERITVAILVDGLLQSQKDSVENADKFTMRSDDDIKYYEDIVKKTIGFNSDRGDELSVNIMPFTEIETGEIGEVEKDYMPIVFTVLRYLVPVIVALLFFLMVVKPLIGYLSRMPQKLPSAGAAFSGAEGDMSLKPREISSEKNVIEWASKNPQEAAGMVKGWLEEN